MLTTDFLFKNKSIYNFLKLINVIKFPKNERFYFFNYIKAISEFGGDEKRAINSKLKEYRKRNKFILEHILIQVKDEVDKGKKFSEALYSAGLLNEREYHILKISKGGLASGIEKILEADAKSSKSTAALGLLLVPPTFMLVALLATHDMVKGVLYDMMAPIRDSGGTPPPIPDYLMSNTTYLTFNILYFSVLAAVTAMFFFIKYKVPKRFLNILPIIEEEYVLDILKSIHSVSNGGGINISNTAKALAIGEQNPIKKSIFKLLIERTTNGKEKISDVFEEYNINYSTISALQMGEDSKNINRGLEMAIKELETRYARDISFFLKVGMWGGQLGMLGMAGKPMIDIMLLMSVGQLNFKV